MIDKLIRRMITLNYTNEDIVLRLRCKVELVEAIREQIRLSQIVDDKEDWNEDWGE